MTGVNVFVIAGIVCATCVFYTFVGGIKAVVATDAWVCIRIKIYIIVRFNDIDLHIQIDLFQQVIVMFLSVVVVTILGTVATGGFQMIFDKASEGNRLIFFKYVLISFKKCENVIQ